MSIKGLLARIGARLWMWQHAPRQVEQSLARLTWDLNFLKRRMTTYLGDGIALTYLADESPVLVNANDYGGPMNLVIGGLYETDNLDVLLSYLKPDSLVLDIGANLGFFSLQLAKRLRGKGHVHAFEPHPELYDLASRTIYINGLRHRVTLHDFGLSDRKRGAELCYPRHHLGGGAVQPEGRSPRADDRRYTVLRSTLRPLDDVLPQGTAVDLAKIDVEGHELQVLRGMARTIAASPDIVILFEKLASDAGYESELRDFLTDFGLELFGVQTAARLEPLDTAGFAAWQGYAVAVRSQVRGRLHRSFFTLYPAQLHMPGAQRVDDWSATLSGPIGSILFHGPYWFLPQGPWTAQIHGKISGQIMLTIQGRLGHEVIHRVLLDADKSWDTFYVRHDLVHFECVASPTTPGATIELESVTFTRVVA